MDLITKTIIDAITAGITKAGIDTSYNELKTLVQKKFGKTSNLANAIENLENRPDSAGRKELLNEEVAAAKADKDQEIIKAAQGLVEALKMS